MSRAVAYRVLLFRPSHIAYLLLTLILSITLQQVSANPLPDLTQEYQNLLAEASTDNSTDSTTDNNSTIAANTDVYVVKAVVYEIGILTDTDNTTSGESTERQERVDISLFDPPHS